MFKLFRIILPAFVFFSMITSKIQAAENIEIPYSDMYQLWLNNGTVVVYKLENNVHQKLGSIKQTGSTYQFIDLDENTSLSFDGQTFSGSILVDHTYNFGSKYYKNKNNLYLGNKDPIIAKKDQFNQLAGEFFSTEISLQIITECRNDQEKNCYAAIMYINGSLLMGDVWWSEDGAVQILTVLASVKLFDHKKVASKLSWFDDGLFTSTHRPFDSDKDDDLPPRIFGSFDRLSF